MHLACDWQVADGLHFLHTEANQVHRALCPHTVFITSMGAWKLGGLSLSSPAFITAETVGVIPVSYRDPSMERFMRYQQVCSPHTASCAFLYLCMWWKYVLYEAGIGRPGRRQTENYLHQPMYT